MGNFCHGEVPDDDDQPVIAGEVPDLTDLTEGDLENYKRYAQAVSAKR